MEVGRSATSSGWAPCVLCVRFCVDREDGAVGHLPGFAGMYKIWFGGQ